MTTKDYYKILGVSEDATAEEIKKIYRALAKQYHPDRNKGKHAEERFKEINEAYDVLGDTEKRGNYDQFRKLGGAGGPGLSWEELMKQFGGGMRFNTGRGFDFSNLGKSFGVDDLFGNFMNGSDPAQRKRTRTTEEIAFATEEEAARNDLDLRLEAPLNLAQVLLGTKIRLRTPQGQKVDLRIPPGTDPGHVFRLPGMGKKQGNETGDLFVVAKVQMPKQLSAEQKELLEKFAQSLGLKY
ncbi:MAG: DnaJ domain-containing protein [candidate division KSB1 bacterium]